MEIKRLPERPNRSSMFTVWFLRDLPNSFAGFKIGDRVGSNYQFLNLDPCWCKEMQANKVDFVKSLGICESQAFVYDRVKMKEIGECPYCGEQLGYIYLEREEYYINRAKDLLRCWRMGKEHIGGYVEGAKKSAMIRELIAPGII